MSSSKSIVTHPIPAKLNRSQNKTNRQKCEGKIYREVQGRQDLGVQLEEDRVGVISMYHIHAWYNQNGIN